MIELLFNSIFKASLFGSMGIVLIIALKRTYFKKYTQAFNNYIWLFIIVRMILPFKIPICISTKIIDNKNLTASYNQYSNLPIFKTMGFIWLGGFLFLLAYNVFSYLKFLSKLRPLISDISDNNIKKIYSKLTLQMNIKRKISLNYCDGLSTPLGIGILKPNILLPKSFHYNNKQIEWILKHELTHYKKYDLIYKIIVMITSAIHWFNPLVHVMSKLINFDCELSCDESILKTSNMEERKFYATILIESLKINKDNALRSNLSIGLQLNSNKIILKRRLIIMLNSKMRKKGIAALAIITVLVTSSFVTVSVFAEGKNTTPPVTSSKITSTGAIDKANPIVPDQASEESAIIYQYTTTVICDGSTFAPVKE